MSEWQPVKGEKPMATFGEWLDIETAPKDGGNVLLWCVDLVGGNGRVATGSWHGIYSGSWWDFHMEYTLNPTHWMPLPDPPVIETEDAASHGTSGSVRSEAQK